MILFEKDQKGHKGKKKEKGFLQKQIQHNTTQQNKTKQKKTAV